MQKLMKKLVNYLNAATDITHITAQDIVTFVYDLFYKAVTGNDNIKGKIKKTV